MACAPSRWVGGGAAMHFLLRGIVRRRVEHFKQWRADGGGGGESCGGRGTRTCALSLRGARSSHQALELRPIRPFCAGSQQPIIEGWQSHQQAAHIRSSGVGPSRTAAARTQHAWHHVDGTHHHRPSILVEQPRLLIASALGAKPLLLPWRRSVAAARTHSSSSRSRLGARSLRL